VGVLRKLTDQEIVAISRMAVLDDFKVFREWLNDSLNELREKSDSILDDKHEYISKGHRQAISHILNLTNEDEIRTISERVRKRRQKSRPIHNS